MSMDIRWRVVATVLLGLIVLAALGTDAVRPFLDLPTQFTADITAGLIRFLGINAVQDGTMIYRPYVFAYEIYYGCIGILPASALTIAMVLSPAGFNAKLIGLAVGIPLVLTLNIVRLVHLFVLGVEHPEYFWFAHRVVWELAMLGSVLLLWDFWLRWNSENVGGTEEPR